MRPDFGIVLQSIQDSFNFFDSDKLVGGMSRVLKDGMVQRIGVRVRVDLS